MIAEGIWNEDPLTADLEELEKMNASEIYPRRVNANEVLSSQNGEEFVFPIADGTSKFPGGDYEFREPTLGREQTLRSEESHTEIQSESEEPRPTELTDDAVARKDFWSIHGDFICRHQTEPRVQLYVPKEETFSIQLKYIDVTRSTHTQLDVMQEKRIGDNWNVDDDRSLSDFCLDWCHKIDSFERGTSARVYVVRWETDKSSNDYETGSHVARSMDQYQQGLSEKRKARMGERQGKARERAQNERNYFIDPEDEEYQETIKTCKEIVRSSDGSGPCRARRKTQTSRARRELQQGQECPTRFRRQSTLV